MTTFKVFGKIEPPWRTVTFVFEPELRYRIEEPDIDLKAKIAIKNSDVTITCETNRWDGFVTLAWALQYLFDGVSAEINLFTFASGQVYDVHLDRAEFPDGTSQMLISEAPELAAIATACKVTGAGDDVRVDMGGLIPVIVNDPTLMIALHDLTSAIRYGNNSLTNCARAIEALRKSLWGGDEADRDETKEAWDRFRNTLRVSRPYLQTITDASRNSRHGSSAYVSASTRQDVLRKSWTVMNRFLLYRLGGSQPLSESEYPIL